MTSQPPKRKAPPAAKPERKVFSPLSIISLFVGLTEIAMGYPLTHTTGTVQLILTWFVVLFPTAVAAGFFFLSYKKPEALFAQPEFKTVEEATAYLLAMRGIANEVKSDVESIYASAEEVKLIAAQTKISYEATQDLGKQLQEQTEQLQRAITEAEHRSHAHAFFLSGGRRTLR